MSTKTPKKLNLKPILRTASTRCNSAKKKGVSFCENFNQILLITPRQILRRSERNRNKTALEKEEDSKPFPLLDFDAIDSPDLSDTESMNESYLEQRKAKVSKKLKKAIDINNKRNPITSIQRAYYDKVKIEVERRAMALETFSKRAIYNYMERISMLETELWSDVFMPSKPFLSDINNDALVEFNQWLTITAASIFKNNNTTKKIRKTFEISRDANFEKLVSKRRKNMSEAQTTIIQSQSGSGKTQLVYCAAKHMGYEVFEISSSDFQSKSKLKSRVEKAECDLRKLLSQTSKKSGNSYKIPLILIDDADVYFDKDSDYMDYLIELIETTALPLVLTVTDLKFATNLCGKFEESEIQLMPLSHTQEELVFQIQHFLSTLFVYDFDEEEITSIVEASSSDIRAALNILQFFYSPIIMKPLYEEDLPADLFDVPLPTYEEPKDKNKEENKVRYLAELQCDLYRCGILQSKSKYDSFNDKLGYVAADTRYSVLDDVYLEIYNNMASGYDNEPEQKVELDVKWW